MIILITGVSLIAGGIGLIAGYFIARAGQGSQAEHAARARVRAAEDALVRTLRRVPVAQPHAGHHRPSREPATLPSLLLAETVAHADSMWQASEEYLPPAPESQPYLTAEEWQRYCNAGRAVEPVRTGEHPPWTGEIPALTPEAEAAERDRQRYIKAHLAEAAGMTDDEVRAAMQDALDSLRSGAA